MNTSKIAWSGFRSWTRRSPGIVALSSILIVALTPLAIFPEIMGDEGVADASQLLNGTALVFLTLGVVASVGGTGSLVRRLLRGRPRN
jgi:hypothetical protein